MAMIFITGSSAGLGRLAAETLVEQGHQVVLHARNEQRAKDAMNKVQGAEEVLIGDLSHIEETKQLAADANGWGRFDVVIHNAGVYRASAEEILKVNTLAPYLLTCLMHKPKRLIYLSSGMHKHGDPSPEKLTLENAGTSYSDSKLHVVLLAKGVARRWPQVYANAVDPGWVPTKMGGSSAPDDLDKGYETQVWLAVSDEEGAKVSGRYFYHKQEESPHPAAGKAAVQDAFIRRCEQITGVSFPGD